MSAAACLGGPCLDMTVYCKAVGAREAASPGPFAGATVFVTIVPRCGCQVAKGASKSAVFGRQLLHPGMAATDVMSRSQLLHDDTAQQAFETVTADAAEQPLLPPNTVASAPGINGTTSRGRRSMLIAEEPSSVQSQQSTTPMSVAAASHAGKQLPRSTVRDLPTMDFVPEGKIESADFALYAQMHLHNPQFHQQQWEHNELSPPHPVIESFPSFRTPRTTDDLAEDAAEPAAAGADTSAQQQSTEAAAADAPRHLQATQANSSSTSQFSSPRLNGTLPSPSSSHSSLSSPTQQQQPGLTTTRRRSVSLLSQQLATARSAASTAAAEYEAGASGRHRSEFWRYLQEQRAKETAQMEAALARSGHKKQQHQQQYALQPGPPVIVEVEEASPPHIHKQQQQQQQHHQHAHTEEQQHPQQWQPQEAAIGPMQQQQQQLPPLPPKAAALARQQQQQQQALSRSPFAAVANGYVDRLPLVPAPPPGEPAAAAAAAAGPTKPPMDPGAVTGSGASPGLLDAALASREGGWSHQYISGCADATAQQKQRQEQQHGQQLPNHQQGQAASQDGSSHGGQQYQAAVRHRQSNSVLDPQQSMEQPLLLHTESAADLAAMEQQQQQQQQWPAQAWGFSDGMLLPVDHHHQQQQQQYGLWARELDQRELSDGSAAAAAGEDPGYTSLGQLPGDSVKLNQLLAAAAGTPPVPPRGSRFDDMDSVSGSVHGGSYYGGQQQQQRWQQRPGSASLRRSSFGGSSRDAGLYGSSHGSLTRLLAAVGAGNSSSSSLLAQGAGAAATAAAGVVTEHLDSLLGELSLFGERNAAEVGQELAVANSIQQIVSQHRLRIIQAYGDPGSSSSSRRQSSTGAIAAAHLHRSGMKQISGWVGSTIDRTSGWLARSAAAALRSMTSSNSGGQLGYNISSSRPARRRSASPAVAGGGLLADGSRRALPANGRGPAAAGTGGGTLWQYGGSSSSVGGAMGRGVRAAQSQQRGQRRQQQPLGRAARRWR